MSKVFIAGTDTGIGKTYVACQLLEYFKGQGLSCIGIKPLASGCESPPKPHFSKEGAYNEDALLLQKAASVQLPYEIINPIALKPPIAPHLAAEKANLRLSVAALVKACQAAFNIQADLHLIEGVGGWLVPLNDKENMGDFVMAISPKVILVVGMKLGCLNHALLSCQSIKNSGCELIGWIANCIDPAMLYLNENIQSLEKLLTVPLLAVLPYNGKLTVNQTVLLETMRLRG